MIRPRLRETVAVCLRRAICFISLLHNARSDVFDLEKCELAAGVFVLIGADCKLPAPTHPASHTQKKEALPFWASTCFEGRI